MLTIGDNLRYTNGWPVHEKQLKEALGLSASQVKRMPANLATWPQNIGNVQVYILTSEDAKAMHPKSEFAHRVIACCPHCGIRVSAGRFSQHMKVHKGEK